MYPLKFDNLYVEKIWGGRKLEKFRQNLPKGKIGESWDVFSSQLKSNKVINGKFEGMTLESLIKQHKDKLIGKKIDAEKFPLLVKIIDANQDLSVQVHPDDKYAIKNEDSLGKTELWYVLEAEDDAQIVVGKKNSCSKEEFLDKIGTKDVEDCLQKVNVSAGDVYFIESGLIHAIGEGIMLVEIQQNSDITYRVYDYDRNRDIHIEEAKQVINFKLKGEKRFGNTEKNNGNEITKYVSNKYFSIEKIHISNKYKDKSDEERFYIYTCVSGKGKIQKNNRVEEINYGDSILIPASMGNYEITGNLEVLKTIPSIN